MNDLEQTKYIIESKFHIEIFDAISEYLQDNPDAFYYVGDYYNHYLYELSLCDYKIVELYYVVEQGTKRIEIVVEAIIDVFDVWDLGLNRNMTEKLRIGANVDSMYENFEVVYVGQYISCF